MPPRKKHDVSVVVNNAQFEGWNSYDIQTDMLEIADSFTMSIPFTKTRFELLRPDSSVKVYIDDTRILSGFIDDRTKDSDRSGSVITISGRDKGGRLVDESAPLLKFQGKTILQLAEVMADIWFDVTTDDNTRNRLLVRGRGRKAKAGIAGTPAFRAADGSVVVPEVPAVPAVAAQAGTPGIFNNRSARKKVNPGESRWDVLKYFLEEAQLLAWSSADGDELIIGLPDYAQERQYYLFNPSVNSDRVQDGNIASMSMKDTVGERYSILTACGSGRGGTANYGKNLLKRIGTVRNNGSSSGDGTGEDFIYRKQLLVSDDDIKNAKTARERAEQKMAERDAGAFELTCVTPYHGQIVDGDEPTLYAFDTIATFEDEEIDFKQDLFITAVRFRGDRSGGESTELRMVPKDTLLRI